MDNLSLVSVCDACQHLTDKFQTLLHRHTPLPSLQQRRLPQRRGDDKAVVDNAGVFDWQNVRVVEPGNQAGFIPERSQRIGGDVLVMRNFQRNADTFDRIVRSINRGKPSQSQPLFDPVFPDVLPRFEQCLASLRRVFTRWPADIADCQT